MKLLYLTLGFLALAFGSSDSQQVCRSKKPKCAKTQCCNSGCCSKPESVCPASPGLTDEDIVEFSVPEPELGNPNINNPAFKEPEEIGKLDNGGCVLDGQKFRHNDIWKTDACTICMCTPTDEINCEVIQCDVTECPEGYVLGKAPGKEHECCDTCVPIL